MAKTTKQQTWLNIIIIVLSGLILAFTLLGRFMTTEEQKITANGGSGAANQFQIVSIDFGSIQVKKIDSRWVSSSRITTSDEQAEIIATSWQQVLTSEMPTDELNNRQSFVSIATVLVYIQGTEAPLVIKVEKSNEDWLLTFPATGHYVSVGDQLLNNLLPNSLMTELEPTGNI